MGLDCPSIITAQPSAAGGSKTLSGRPGATVDSRQIAEPEFVFARYSKGFHWSDNPLALISVEMAKTTFVPM
jgi:hypothetical protein